MIMQASISLRPGEQRGHAQHGWLDSYHTFSFGDYHDPKHMGFRALRVINEDRIEPGRGFDTHPHRDMEIISYVLEGALEHKDSMATGSIIRPGDVQRMTAGTGVLHSEFNHSQTDRVHFLQIWILPERTSLPASYEQKHFSCEERRGKLRLVAARDGREGAITVHQDVALYAALLEPGERVAHTVLRGHAWVQVARGAITLNGTTLSAGDGAAVSGEKELAIAATESAELLLFDLA
jgi:redox-sensitive bicupin YhaK (pirin superfamily)